MIILLLLFLVMYISKALKICLLAKYFIKMEKEIYSNVQEKHQVFFTIATATFGVK